MRIVLIVLAAVWMMVLSTAAAARAQSAREKEAPLLTRWAGEAGRGDVLPEYPRPMMVRRPWLNLNGWWDYAVQPRDAGPPGEYDGRIRVPFAIECPLSAVTQRVSPDERLWYRRTVRVPEDWRGWRVLLHFGAVDWEARIRVNGREMGTHRGGYDAFTFDITDVAAPGDEAEIIVEVRDPTDQGGQARGKQVQQPQGIFYTPTTGIWQTVWLEPVPEVSIASLHVVPDVASSSVRLTVQVRGRASDLRLRAEVLNGASVVAAAEGAADQELPIPLNRPRLWSPDDPFLYDLRVSLLDESGRAVDEVAGYFGMRSVSMVRDENGVPRLALNGSILFQIGMLDQGYWPDGGLTAPSDKALRFDVEAAGRMGFNMLRKHVKIEPARWYYWCDRLGILVWQDMASGNNETDADRAQWRTELQRIVRQRWNHPCIIMWVPFNEGWGQHATAEIVAWLKEIDSTRLVNGASGWHDRGAGDVHDIHAYPGPAAPEIEQNRAAVLGEFGGLGLRVPGHMWQQHAWGYAQMPDREALAERYERLLRDVHELKRSAGLAAAVYTQVSDVETEANGLLTYDRAVYKIDPDRVRLANRGFLPPVLTSLSELFIDSTTVALACDQPNAQIRYTLDGSDPTRASTLYEGPFTVRETVDVTARAFREDGEASWPAVFHLQRAAPQPTVGAGAQPGLVMRLYEGLWETMPDFKALEPAREMVVGGCDLSRIEREEAYALVFDGLITVPRTEVYHFFCASDDGTRLFIDSALIVDNDGKHGTVEKRGAAALEKGSHRFRLEYFQWKYGKELKVSIAAPGMEKREISPEMFSCNP